MVNCILVVNDSSKQFTFFFKLFQINRSTCKNLREKFLQAGLAVEMTAACLHRIS